MAQTNHQVRLARRPEGTPTDADFEVTEEEVPDPGDGEVVVRVTHISLDPAMRGWMRDVPSYLPPVGLGEVMRAGGVGEVVASRADGLAEGDHVQGTFGVQEYAVADARHVTKVDTSQTPLPTYLSALGMTGMTAYFGLLDIGRFGEGDTVVVSGAAGAVGSAAGQIAKLRGAGRVVGIAGGPEKCAWVVDELGFDACIDYKNESVRRGLKQHCPAGVDVYFDNVGVPILDDVLVFIRRGARIVICGAISQYNNDRMQGPANYMQLLVQRATMTGFLVFDFADRFEEAGREIAGWLADGRFVTREDIVRAPVGQFATVFGRLFEGANTGKLVLEVEPS